MVERSSLPHARPWATRISKIVAYSRTERVISPNNYVIEYEGEPARFHVALVRRADICRADVRGGRSGLVPRGRMRTRLLLLNHVSNGSDRRVRDSRTVLDRRGHRVVVT